MKNLKFVRLLLVISACLGAQFAWCQANVNEGDETATLYVDAAKGSDSNPGTQQLPLKTIGAATNLALSNNRENIGTKVIINPGTYRESVTISRADRPTSAPMTFQAATNGTAIVSGADIWTGWTPYTSDGTAGSSGTDGSGTTTYTHSWNENFGLCAMDEGTTFQEEDIIRHVEMIMVNGTSLTQVLSQSAMRAGTFYIDQAHTKAYIWPPSGTNMNTATVEVSTRPNLFTITDMSNIVLRGLTFQYASTCRLDAAVDIEYSASNILVDTDNFYWNNAAGLKLGFTTYTTVQNVVANHNGTSGVMGYETLYDLWQNLQTRYNDWRGAQGIYYGWGTAGTHFGLAHNQTVNNIDSSWNQTFGFHWDTDNENDTATALSAEENLTGGGFVERSEGPITISNSNFCNGNPSSGPNNMGFELRNSSDVTLTGDSFLNNNTGITVIGQAGGFQVKNWQTGQTYNLVTQNITLSNDVLTAGTQQELFSDGTLGGSDWSSFQRTLASDYNTWWNSAYTKVFLVPSPANWTSDTFSTWQSLTGQDAHSNWNQPSGSNSCNAAPDYPDYWFIMSAFKGYQNVNKGSSGTFTGYVVPLNFNGNVTLSSDGTQGINGMSGSWSPASITGSGTATFTVSTTKSTPSGTYPITLLATSGNTTHTMTVSVTVQ